MTCGLLDFLIGVESSVYEVFVVAGGEDLVLSSALESLDHQNPFVFDEHLIVPVYAVSHIS